MTSESSSVDGLTPKMRNLGFASNEQVHAVASAGDTGPYANSCYKMDHKRRGKFILINNKRFHQNTGMGERTGTDVDASNLSQLFKKLGFEVQRYDDLTAMQMLNVMVKVGIENHEDCDCFAVAVLSHGEQGILFGVDKGKEYGTITVENFIQPIKMCSSLAGKPKLFFFQACRGSKYDDGIEVQKDGVVPEKPRELARIPREADFLFAYSTTPGYFSWRNRNTGSAFIQALYRVLKDPALKDLDLLRMLTRVNHIVAYEYESENNNVDKARKKQIPSIVSQLTKDLYFS